MCRRHGAIFVLDEMRSGFRIALGGAQEYFDVRADLVTVGKALANGYPVSAVVGSERVLRRLKGVHIGSTHFLSAAEMAAAVATVETLRDSDALSHIRRMGQRFQDGLRSAIRGSGAPAEVVGYPQMPFMQFTHPDVHVSNQWRDAFFDEATRQGLLLHPYQHWYLCAALTEADVDSALKSCALALQHAATAAQG